MSLPLPARGTHPGLGRGRAPLLAVLVLALSSLAGSASAQDEPMPEPELFDPTVLRSWRFDIEAADWLTRLEQGQTVLADLTVEGASYPQVGISEKGNSSARVAGPKQPMNVTLDHEVKGQRLMGYDVVNLNNGFMNPTFTREVLTLRSLAEHMPMPQAGWARIETGDDYLGLYVLVEQIEGTFLDAWFRSNDGWLFKGDAPDSEEAGGPGPGPRPRPLGAEAFGRQPGLGPAAPAGAPAPQPDTIDQGPGGGFRSSLSWEGEDLASYQANYTLKSDAADDTPWEALRELTRVLDAPEAEGGPSPAEFPEAIRRVLDVDGALWYLAGQNLFTNFDSYYSGHNFYLYQAEEDGRWHILAWDQNEAFGLFPGAGVDPGDSTAVARTDPFLMAEGSQAASRPLIRRLLGVPALRADYLAHYRTLLETVFEPSTLEARIGSYQDLIREAVETDPNRLYDFGLFEQNVREDVSVGNRSLPGILKVAEARVDWLGQRDDLAAPDLTLAEMRLLPSEPVSGQATEVGLRFEGEPPAGVELVYEIEKGLPERLAMREDGEGAWLASIPDLPKGSDVDFYARAALADGRAAFFPASNLLHPWHFKVAGTRLPLELGGPLVINEILADNESGLADPFGELDDWLELYNRGSEPLELGDYYLSDDEEDPAAYALPAMTLAPGAHLLIWCDNDPDQGPDHAGFRLSKDGETVILSTETVTVDRVEMGAQLGDVSWARLPDGADRWQSCASPSPGETNRCDGSLPTPTVDPGPGEPTATPGDPAPGPRLYLPVLRLR